jgi:ATP-binding cassette subfamily F protein 3
MKIGYDGEPLLETPELLIERGDRIGLLGPNGSGKTTLIKTLVGEIPALGGYETYGTNVKPGYYAQSHEQLRERDESTPLSVILYTQAMSEEFARTYLGRFLFTGDDVYKNINALSGGERSRLALAVLLLEQANFLVLDEPTNHLDIHARETLEQMLTDFDGTILFVSHDRYFMDRIATKLWIVEDETVLTSLGNYTDYQRQLGRRASETEQKEELETPKPELVATEPADDEIITSAKGKPRKRTDADAQKELAQIEREVSRLEGRLNELNDALTIATIDADVDAIARLGEEYEKTQTALDDVYARWEAASARTAAFV